MKLIEWRRWWKTRGYDGVRRILWEEWDPIGVNDNAEAEGEYDSYVGPIGRMLREGRSASDVEAYLRSTGLEQTEIHVAPELHRRAAEALVRWYAEEMRA